MNALGNARTLVGSDRSSVEDEVFPCDICGRPLSYFQSYLLKPHIAHLMSHDDEKVLSWRYLVPYVGNLPNAYGVTRQVNNWTDDEYRKLLNGYSPRDPQGDQNEEGRRRNFTGLKHQVVNKIRLAGQAENYDYSPNIIIVPIMTMAQARDWGGQDNYAYDAIVLSGIHVDITGVADEAEMKDRNHLLQETTGLFVCDQHASREELETATDLLRDMLKAFLVAKHRYKSPDEEIDIQEVPLPVLRDVIEKLVTKVSFVAPLGNSQGHPAPDPFFLAAKGAVNFIRRQGLATLSASAEPKDDDDLDELDEIALERFLEWQQPRAPDNYDDLATQLGQPGAARPDDWVEGMTSSSDAYREGPPTIDVRALLNL